MNIVVRVLLLTLCFFPVKATSEVALGFSFFRESSSISLLRVKDRSIIGADFGLKFYRNGSTAWIAYPALRAVNIHRTGEFAPLSYVRLGVSASKPDGLRSTRGTLGMGFIWKPPQKKNISLSVKQGFSIYYHHKSDSWGGQTNPAYLFLILNL